VNFAEELRQLFNKSGLTVEQLAKRANCAPGTISKAMNGEKRPSWDITKAFIAACDDDPATWRSRWEHAAPTPGPPPSGTPGGGLSDAAGAVAVASDGSHTSDPPAAAAGNPATGDGGAGAASPRMPTTSPRWWSRPRVYLAVVAVVAVLAVLTGLLYPNDEENIVAAVPVCAGPANDQLRIAASQDKDQLLAQAAGEYGLRTVNGRCVQVVVDQKNSGVAMTALARGWDETDGPRPDVWSPASSVWLPLARQRATPATSGVFPEQDPPPIVTTPLVIAMPQPMAQALGWPNQNIGWQELAQLAADPQGWARYGHPEWGPFRLGKTNPNYSSSGLNATIATFFALTGRTNELIDKDITNPDVQNFVSGIERSIVHYGETTLTFLTNLRHADDTDAALSYISAVTVEESSMLAYNQGYPCGASTCAKQTPPGTKLVAIYPEEGTLVSDHPYIELGWMDATKKAVAADFLTYLHSEQAQHRFQEFGFRTHQGEPSPLATPPNGANPRARIMPLGVPTGPVLNQLLEAWSTLRKPANVLLVMDTSKSMEGLVPGTGRTKLQLLKQAETALLDGFTDTDRVGLWKFSVALDGDRDYLQLVPPGPIGEALTDATTRRDLLSSNIEGLTLDSGTGLYDTIAAAVSTMNTTLDPNAINAVVLLTDGRNEKRGGIETVDQLLDQLPRTAPNQPALRVFTVAYGSDADEKDLTGRSVLQRIATATGGALYDAKDPRSINEVLTAVISNF